MSNKHAALVIGASGGIGSALVQKLVSDERFDMVHAVSRKPVSSKVSGVEYHQVNSEDEQQISDVCEKIGKEHQITLAVCLIGMLHDESGEPAVQPEKKIEDLNADSLQRYFLTNTILPSLWLKALMPVVKGNDTAHVVCFSARVGSISDNRLGGWYGYRASKAALNMMIKTASVEYARRAKNVCLVSYHPGTVDTALSEPFQANVKKEKLFEPSFTVDQLLSILKPLSAEQSPQYLDWQGETISW